MKFWGLLLLLGGNAWALWAMDLYVFDESAFGDTFSILGSWPVGKYVMVGFLFSIINTIIRPVIALLTIPLKWLTLGLFGFVLNAGMLWVAEYVVNFLAIADISLSITSILTYFIAGLILSIINHILHWFV